MSWYSWNWACDKRNIIYLFYFFATPKERKEGNKHGCYWLPACCRVVVFSGSSSRKKRNKNTMIDWCPVRVCVCVCACVLSSFGEKWRAEPTNQTPNSNEGDKNQKKWTIFDAMGRAYCCSFFMLLGWLRSQTHTQFLLLLSLLMMDGWMLWC